MNQNSGFSVRRTIVVILATVGVLAILSVSSCIALLGFGISSFSKSLKSISNGQISSVSTFTNNNQSFNVPRKTDQYIAGIKFKAEINDHFADNIIEKLHYAKNDTNAVGVLLEVDSPGGVVVPSQEIYDAVKLVAETKPVVSYVRSIAASGAYYSIAPSSEIVANRGSLIGSIGVIMQGIEVNELLKLLKIHTTTIKSGTLKDAGSPLRPMTANDKEYLNELVSQIFEIFMNDVKKVRPAISQKDLTFMSDGRVVLAQQAKELKLIDLIGSQEVAKDELSRLAKLKSTPEVFYYEDYKPFVDLFAEKFVSESAKKIKSDIISQNILPR